jgi:hypothetical protein
MNDVLKAILILIVYFLLQSIILALFATLIWQLLLAETVGLSLGYWHWFGILFIANLLRFDTVEKINNFDKMMGKTNVEIKLKKEDEIY